VDLSLIRRLCNGCVYLTPSETIEAIREPIVAARADIDEDALDELASESAGYPYFIQAYGSAALGGPSRQTHYARGRAYQPTGRTCA